MWSFSVRIKASNFVVGFFNVVMVGDLKVLQHEINCNKRCAHRNEKDASRVAWEHQVDQELKEIFLDRTRASREKAPNFVAEFFNVVVCGDLKVLQHEIHRKKGCAHRNKKEANRVAREHQVDQELKDNSWTERAYQDEKHPILSLGSSMSSCVAI